MLDLVAEERWEAPGNGISIHWEVVNVFNGPSEVRFRASLPSP
ncbi:MAG TPA: hypothetical protein VFH78_01985 [Candidatus Thermoplasmatota archaeon]|nr:hypothetical protein [Candidatus Thermoplasmatota archaeon]